MKQREGLRMRAVIENVPLAIDYVTQCAETAGFDARALYEIQLAVDEACANVVDHAYQGMDPGEFEVFCLLDELSLTIDVRDWGRGFEPQDVEQPDVEAPLGERTLGGLGLYIVNKVMDDIEFTFDPRSGNRLRMAKRIRVAE
jgi:anti-sigma regulatory factor (Ser/Thr protein kinase)